MRTLTVLLLAFSLAAPNSTYAQTDFFSAFQGQTDGVPERPLCPEGQRSFETVHGKFVCVQLMPFAGSPCPQGMALHDADQGEPLCGPKTKPDGKNKKAASLWNTLPMDGTTPFNQECRYRIKFSSPNHDSYAPYFESSVGATVLYADGVGPSGDLIFFGFDGKVSGVRHNLRRDWNTLPGMNYLKNAVLGIEEQC